MYGYAAGISPDEDAPGFERVIIAPHPDKRIAWFEARYDSDYGTITSRWEHTPDGVRYEITTPVEAEITIAGETRTAGPGSYLFYE